MNKLKILNYILISMIILLLIFIYNMLNLLGMYYSYSYQNDTPVLKYLDIYCNNDSDIDNIYCINSIVNDFYSYNSSKEFISPDKLLSNGGDCKSWSMFYKTALDKLEIKNKFIRTNNHLFIMAYGDNYWCSLDQRSINCEYLE